MLIQTPTKRRIVLLSLAVFLILLSCDAFADKLFFSDNGAYYEYALNEHGATLLSYSVSDLSTTPEIIQIPAKLDGHTIYSIGANAFNAYIMQNKRKPYDEQIAYMLILPEGLLRLDSYALNGCEFQRVSLPSSLVEIEGDLSGVTAIIEVAEENQRYASDKGFLVDKQDSTLLYTAPSSSNYSLPYVEKFAEFSLQNYQPETIVFPVSAVYIASYTCYDNTETKSVIIPGNVRIIADNAFYAMGADKFTLSSGIRSIGAYAFYNTEINELSIPESVEWLGFEFCQDEVDIIGYPAVNCHWETEEEFEERMDLVDQE